MNGVTVFASFEIVFSKDGGDVATSVRDDTVEAVHSFINAGSDARWLPLFENRLSIGSVERVLEGPRCKVYDGKSRTPLGWMVKKTRLGITDSDV